MSRVSAHEEIGLGTELLIVLRKKEIRVLLGLLLTLVGSSTHGACWLLLCELLPRWGGPNSFLKTRALDMRALEVLVQCPGSQHCHSQ